MTILKLIDPKLFNLTDDEVRNVVTDRNVRYDIKTAYSNELLRRGEVAALTSYIADEPSRIAELERQIQNVRDETERDRRRLAKLNPTQEETE